jgi:hypothetical protein
MKNLLRQAQDKLDGNQPERPSGNWQIELRIILYIWVYENQHETFFIYPCVNSFFSF